jgi:hypothetical protein
MNRKQLTLILVAFVLLGGLGLWLRSRDAATYRASAAQMGQKVLGDFAVNDVARLRIRKGTNTLTLALKDDRWVVAERADYPANFTEIGETLRKLWDLKVVQPIAGPLGPAALERLELNPDATNNPATVVELLDKDGKALRTLLLGKQHRRQPATPSPFGGDEGWPDGRYVMLQGAAANGASLVSETFSQLEPRPESWLNRDFFKVEKPRTIAVTYPDAPTNSWKMTRASETNDWTLADAQPQEKLDTSKVSVLGSVLSWPSFEDVVVTDNPAALGLDKPVQIEIETFDGFRYTLRAAQKGTEEKYHLLVDVAADFPKERTPGANEKPEDKEKLDKEFKEKTDKLTEKLRNEKALAGRVFLVSKWTLDSVLKKRSDFLQAEKPADTKAAASEATSGAAAPAANPVDATLPPAPPEPEEE